jgi:chromosome segregation ATPase
MSSKLLNLTVCLREKDRENRELDSVVRAMRQEREALALALEESCDAARTKEMTLESSIRSLHDESTRLEVHRDYLRREANELQIATGEWKARIMAGRQTIAALDNCILRARSEDVTMQEKLALQRGTLKDLNELIQFKQGLISHLKNDQTEAKAKVSLQLLL